MARSLEELRVKIFADGAHVADLIALARQSYIKGVTTNPTLMAKAGVTDYERFAKEVLAAITDKPVSFEVFADDLPTMEQQGRIIARWGEQVYVKIPITTTRGESTAPLIQRLTTAGIRVNVTALMTVDQVRAIAPAFAAHVPGIISVFAGRVADTGRDPVPLMKECRALLREYPHLQLLWASPREVLNVFQADEVGCDIITVTGDILKKLERIGYDLHALSRDTVQMFYDDGRRAGYQFRTLSPHHDYITTYLKEVETIARSIDTQAVQRAITVFKEARDRKGRLFIIGVGGSAANASHAVNDFRKIFHIEAYAPTDNVAELTAWANDASFDDIFHKWLEGSRFTHNDALLVLSVGGGSETTSRNLVLAMRQAKDIGAPIVAIVSRDGGMAGRYADVLLHVPVVAADRITPHAEEWQAVLWHLLVNAS